MASTKQKALKPEVLSVKCSSAERIAYLMTAAMESGSMTRSKVTPAISRRIRAIK